MQKLKIGLEARLLNGQLTGVGNYTFQILQAIMAAHDEISYCGFGVRSWTLLNDDSLRDIEEQRSGPAPTPANNQTLIRKLGAKARSKLTRMGFAQAVYRDRFSRSIKAQSLDLFHAFNYLPVADPGIVTLPVIYDLSFVRYPDYHPIDRLRILEKLPWLLERAPTVQTISQFSKDEIARFYGYDKAQIFIAPPAAAQLYRPLGIQITTTDVAKHGLTPGQYFLSVGTLEPRKNLRTLIAAYSQISKSVRDRFPLVVVGGKGWGELDLPNTTDSLVDQGCIRFVGSVSNDELRSLYEGAVALLYPSVYEGFGMPVIECMACGTRVIHSARTSMDEITAGLVPTVQALDVDAWSEAIKQLIELNRSDVTSSQLIAQAATFSWSESAEKVVQGYEAITRQSP